jgi:putative ABC transport system permease protein
MKLAHISFGNLKRRKGKAALLVAGLSIGVALVVALVGITSQMKADVERKLDEYGANILIVPKTEKLSLSYGGVSITDTSYDVQELRESDADIIMTIPNKKNISAVAPKVIGTQKIKDLSYLVSGVDFSAELLIKKWWQVEGAAPESPNEVLLGSRVSEAVGLKAGDRLSMKGSEYLVAGVLGENASQDDITVFMNIQEARRLLGKEGMTSMIEVSALCSDCPIDDIVAQISEKLPHAKVSPVRQAMTLKMQTVDQVMKFSIAVSLVVLLIGSFIVFISLLSSVNERTKEIGVLRAIGYRRSHVVKIILIEAFVVSFLAGLIGWAGGSFTSGFLAPEGMVLSGLAFNPLTIVSAVLISLCIGMLSSIYPAVKASNLEPSEALRYI